MSDQQPNQDWGSYEKEEKAREKEEEKRYEKSEEEKSWDEKWRRDPVAALGWALIFMWAGGVLLLDNMGYLARFERLDPWDFILIGAGGVVLLQVLIRLIVPSYRRPVIGSLIVAFALFAIGLGSILPTNIIWPVGLILLGLAVLVTALTRKR
jgi:hypothetical protein